MAFPVTVTWGRTSALDGQSWLGARADMFPCLTVVSAERLTGVAQGCARAVSSAGAQSRVLGTWGIGE